MNWMHLEVNFLSHLHTKTNCKYLKSMNTKTIKIMIIFFAQISTTQPFHSLCLPLCVIYHWESKDFFETFHLFVSLFFVILKFSSFHTRIVPKINHFSLNGKTKIVAVFFSFSFCLSPLSINLVTDFKKITFDCGFDVAFETWWSFFSKASDKLARHLVTLTVNFHFIWSSKHSFMFINFALVLFCWMIRLES